MLGTVGGLSLLLVCIIFTITRMKKESDKIEKKESRNKFKIMSLMILLIVLVVVFIYYPLENFLFGSFKYEYSIEIFDKSAGVLISLVGIIVTSVFSYLIYISTKEGLRIANDASDSSRQQKDLSTIQTELTKIQTNLTAKQTGFSEKQIELEDKRYKDEQVKKYSEIHTVPEVRLLMSIDFLLNEFSNLKNEFILSKTVDLKHQILTEFWGR